ncbi:MAG: polysaccharide biosynthesis C-terminal domain-containing protein, partial [Clostridiales bacterium]|nr:polysaccharide biosynthesis C-terminal domain-containing protein [Clostridiales bacterium]
PLDGAHTVAVIVLGMGVSEVFSSLVLTLTRLARQRRPDGQTGRAAEAGVARRSLLQIALPVGFTALLGNLMGSVNAILVPQLLVLAGYTASGAMEAFGVVFGMTLPLLNLPFAFVNALSLSILPRLTECCTLGRRAELNRYIETALSSISLLVLPLMALLVTLGGDVGALLFHDSRVGALLLPLSVGSALSAYEAVLNTVLNGIGRQKQGAVISLFCGGVQLGCTLLLTGRLGFYAYALGTAVSSLLGFWLRIRVVVRQGGVEIRWFPVVTAPALSALLMGSVVNLLYRSLRDSGTGLWEASALAALAGCTLYLAALLAQGGEPVSAAQGGEPPLHRPPQLQAAEAQFIALVRLGDQPRVLLHHDGGGVRPGGEVGEEDAPPVVPLPFADDDLQADVLAGGEGDPLPVTGGIVPAVQGRGDGAGAAGGPEGFGPRLGQLLQVGGEDGPAVPGGIRLRQQRLGGGQHRVPDQQFLPLVRLTVGGRHHMKPHQPLRQRRLAIARPADCQEQAGHQQPCQKKGRPCPFPRQTADRRLI